MIYMSAIRLKDGVVCVAKRHSELIQKCQPGFFRGAEQGFMTDAGVFLTRQEAETHARECGQLTGPLIGSVLTSEDLW